MPTFFKGNFTITGGTIAGVTSLDVAGGANITGAVTTGVSNSAAGADVTFYAHTTADNFVFTGATGAVTMGGPLTTGATGAGADVTLNADVVQNSLVFTGATGALDIGGPVTTGGTGAGEGRDVTFNADAAADNFSFVGATGLTTVGGVLNVGASGSGSDATFFSDVVANAGDMTFNGATGKLTVGGDLQVNGNLSATLSEAVTVLAIVNTADTTPNNIIEDGVYVVKPDAGFTTSTTGTLYAPAPGNAGNKVRILIEGATVTETETFTLKVPSFLAASGEAAALTNFLFNGTGMGATLISTGTAWIGENQGAILS